MAMNSPRPILKRSPTPNHRPCHAVHFPPSPSLTTHTYSVYSAAAYDRSPIVVSPNTCALPERGCPGRTYTLEEGAPSIPKSPKKPSYESRERHPRALAPRDDAPRSPRRTHGPTPPPLIPDLSSESDESDSFLHTPLETSSLHHVHGLAIPQAKYQVLDAQPYAYGPLSPSALSFLPHPPSPPARTTYVYEPSCEDSPLTKSKRRRERKTDGSRTSSGMDEFPVVTPSKCRSSRIAALSIPSFCAQDDGCLGGF